MAKVELSFTVTETHKEILDMPTKFSLDDLLSSINEKAIELEYALAIMGRSGHIEFTGIRKAEPMDPS